MLFTCVFTFILRADFVSHQISIKEAILSLSPNSSTSAEIDHFKRSASELLDALEHKYALAATLADNVDQIGTNLSYLRRIERGNCHLLCEIMLAEDGPPAKRFMLHRSLAEFDLFTSAVDLTASELEALASGKYPSSRYPVLNLC